MAINWYPVIDYIQCIECGNCVSKCPRQVYDNTKAPTPVVISPSKCIDHCHGCGNKCPVGAITYVGDDTDWTPPSGKKSQQENDFCCCGGSCL